jgi:hypothetical protein
VLNALVSVIEARDFDALSNAIGAEVRVETRIVASCSASRHFGS